MDTCTNKEKDMTVNIDDDNNEKVGFFRGLISDVGLQHSLAAVLIATLVAGTRKLIFKV